MTTKDAAAVAETNPRRVLPLFFQRIEMLDSARHADLKVDRSSGLRFAAGANSIPLCVDEVIAASDFFPVVFSQGSLTPMAVIGCRDGENVFVNARGQWRGGTYLPAYLRAWPFIAVASEESVDKLFIAIEPDSPQLRTDVGLPLFDNGKPTRVLSEISGLCTSYHNSLTATRRLGQALAAAGLLHDRGATVKFRNGDEIQLGGFNTLDPEKFNASPDRLILEWKKNGWLAAIYAVLRSTARWSRLVDETEQRRVQLADSVVAGLAEPAS